MRAPSPSAVALSSSPALPDRASRTSRCVCSIAGSRLVSDDQTVVKREGDRLIAAAAPNIAGKLEVRGIGIVEIDHISDVPVAMVVELTSDIERMPDDSRERTILGVALPLISIDATTASAPSKIAIALDRLGLKF